jgi:flavin-dependent dehydrogenase
MKNDSPVRLEDGSRIGIVGGGPAGSFFAIDVLRRVKAEQRSIHVTIIEKKRESRCQDSLLQPTQREG